MSESSRKRSAPRLALRLEEAAESIGVSDEFFSQHVRPNVRIVRRGRVKLVPVAELEKWLDRNAAYAIDTG